MYATPRFHPAAAKSPTACGHLRTSAGSVRPLRAATLAALAFLAMAGSAFAATITVTSTDDTVAAGDGKVTLREAIAAIDAGGDLGDADIVAQSPGVFGDNDTIAFDIPGGGVRTIRPSSALPAITRALAIDGFTQPGAAANTIASGPQGPTSHALVGGSNAVLLVELDGSAAGAGADGLAVEGDSLGVTLRGLVINRFGGSGIRLTGGIDAAIEGDYIGTDAGGTTALGNGVGITGSNDGYLYARVGGSDADSFVLVSGNTGAGVHLQGTGGPSPQVACNYAYVGTDAGGTQALGNGGNGIELRGSAGAGVRTCVVAANGGNGIDVGDSATAEFSGYLWVGVGVGDSALGNTGHGLHYAGSAWGDPGYWDAIQHNGGAGVRVEDDALVYVDPLPNIIADNLGLAIDIGPEGPTPNDPGDADGGANLGQNSPVVATATSTAADGTTFGGSIDTTPDTQIEIMLAFDSQCDASRLGQSRLAVPFATNPTLVVTTDASGHADWTWHDDMALDVSTYAYVSGIAVAPRPAGAHVAPVSEFSPCARIVGAGAPAPGTLQFGAASYAVAENAGLVDVVVTRSGGTAGEAGATLATADGTAHAGSDYIATTVAVHFADGDTEPKHVGIPIVDDAVAEDREQFTVSLSSPIGATLGAPATATVTIDDDDNPTIFPTTTTLTAAPNPAAVGQTVAFTATVAAANAVPTGSVTFLDGATPLASVALDGGIARYATATLGAGTHAITATYPGAAGFAASGADTGVTITAAPVATAVPTPTLSPSAMLLFGMLLIGIAAPSLRRRPASR